MVKFQVFWVKKTYKHSRQPYRYRGILLKVPKKFHEKIDPHLDEQFDMKSIIVHETADKKIVEIVLVRNKGLPNAK